MKLFTCSLLLNDVDVVDVDDDEEAKSSRPNSTRLLLLLLLLMILSAPELRLDEEEDMREEFEATDESMRDEEEELAERAPEFRPLLKLNLLAIDSIKLSVCFRSCPIRHTVLAFTT